MQINNETLGVITVLRSSFIFVLVSSKTVEVNTIMFNYLQKHLILQLPTKHS